MRNLNRILLINSIFFALDASAQERMGLSTFLDKVRVQNLGLKVEGSKSEAANAKTIGLAIPTPMIGVSRMKDDASNNSAYGFEVSQSIPFPSRLVSEQAGRKYAAAAQRETFRATEKDILAKAKILYISLWVAQEKSVLLQQKKSIITNHIKVLRSSVRSDSFASIHLLKAESDFDILELDIISSEQIIAEKQTAIAALLNENLSSFRIIADEPKLSGIPGSTSIDISHQIQATNLGLEAFKSKEREAKASWYPDLNLRYKQVEPNGVSSRTSEVMVGVSLPFVFFWQPDAAAKTAGAERIQAEFELAKQRRDIESERVILLSKIESQKKQLEILNGKLIPRAEKRMQMIHNVAPRDMETLQDHRETLEAFPDLKLKALELRQEYEEAISVLEKYMPTNEAYHE